MTDFSQNGHSEGNFMTNREMLSDMHTKTNRMYNILLGDEQANVEGLVQKVSRHQKYISADKKLKWTLTGVLTGANIGFMAWIKNHLGL